GSTLLEQMSLHGVRHAPGSLEANDFFLANDQRHGALGSFVRADEHDLSTLGDHPLRSHGGLSEQQLPLLLSR
uniref:Phosphonoacetate hydrolase (Fragments) n=1 Tax=Penicillium oxalicum TaxID=69781 RepID=PHNHY_PENOX|nr:RecName: Full=Phosphonoacetate hydrolase; Short=PA-hydrolase [Penicillium oxalicum]